jgi:hypothetical protein
MTNAQDDRTGRIIAIYRAATAAQLAEGTDWYSAARTFSIGLAERYGLTLEQAAGIVAAISPRLPWDRNMAYADLLMRTGDCPTLKGNKAKAVRILSGERPLDVLGGAKVRAFYLAILGDPDAVVVDRHAFDVAYGAVTDDRTRKALDRVGGYDGYANAYRAAATALGTTAVVVQAVTWVVWRASKRPGMDV